ncbi:peptidylprolyl isomerase [Pelagicoccus mobilis]|uniref:peptidylprolyl isomerase n=1 Tax=Pelagicoccus mobilis TaxID=415221 RepID=A0A934S3T7_9BACT|nr:peptidylprolyl isomerase [Pelagicoccus mobilis]
MYAVFTTSSGEFTAKLYHDQTPITVANFVGLAEGSVHRWDNEDSEPITGPYYDGIIFHRVISGFMIQGGSPNGLGTDGPGYSIPDEISPDLKHTKAGQLSMANSGPNSGGSQFFITLGAAAWLDGKHAIFGEIVDGQSIVNAIGDLPTGTADRPNNPPVIESITIVREGEEAAQFNPRDYEVPNIGYPKVEFHEDGEQYVASFDRRTNADYIIRRTEDLDSWETDDSVTGSLSAPSSHDIDVTEDISDSGSSFIEVTELSYPKTIDAVGTQLTIKLEGNDDISITLNEDIEGTYTFGESEGTVNGYLWFPMVSRDQLFISFSGLRNMQLHLTWSNDTEGRVVAHLPDTFQGAGNAFTVEGTFTANSRPTEN